MESDRSARRKEAKHSPRLALRDQYRSGVPD
jgi:hypothetical protein